MESTEWDQLDLAPEVKIQVESLVESLLAQAQDKIKHQANEIKQLEEKNQALVYELAHLRRMRYGSKSEAISATQLSLLDENYQTEVAAIETEIEQLPQPKNQSAFVPDASHCLIIYRVSSIVTSNVNIKNKLPLSLFFIK